MREYAPNRFLVTALLLVCGLSLLTAHANLPQDDPFLRFVQRFTETSPPTGEVRPVAEFEPASHVLIRYPLGIPTALVTHLSNTAQVICIVSSTSVQNQATNTFNTAGVNMANVSFMLAPTDSYWTRDFGPWFIWDGDNCSVVDFQYNRPRPNDNMIPQTFATQQSFPYFGMNLQQTGGNYMNDGINTAAQTQIAYSENSSFFQAQVGLKMQQYLGIDNYWVIQDPNNTYIDHIDCWGKFLAPDKVLIRSVPTSHAQYDEIEAVATYFATQNCAWGYPYKVYRVNTPGNQPYTNSLILNKKVFVPTMGGSYDAAALAVYHQALPGYEVIAISGNPSYPWGSTDALHCRTHEVPDRQVLAIEHNPIWGVQTENSFDINAHVRPYSTGSVIADSVFVSYRVNQGPWSRAMLTQITGYDYTVSLQGFAPGDTIRYFIHAADTVGKSNDHPLTAAYDPHLFVIEADITSPVISHTPLSIISNQPAPVIISADVTDAGGISQVLFRYRIDGGTTFEYPMEHLSGSNWIYAYVPEFTSTDINFYYQIIATDNDVPPNVTFYPSTDSWVQVPIDYVGINDPAQSPLVPRLGSVFPNPFKPGLDAQLNIDYQAAKGSPVTLEIFNLRGQRIYSETLVSASDGSNHLSWNGRENSGKISTAGVYLLRLSVANTLLTKKIILGL